MSETPCKILVAACVCGMDTGSYLAAAESRLKYILGFFAVFGALVVQFLRANHQGRKDHEEKLRTALQKAS
jgi:hypothetical protein